MSPNPWYHKGLRFKCQGSGRCCHNHGDYSFVYLTTPEVEQLAKATGLGKAEFTREFCQRVDGWITLRMDTPACPFLNSEMRCNIYDIRPRQCRAWPFWEENLERATWEGPVSQCCPGVGQGPLYPAAEIERIARETEEWFDEDA
jgi:hypothetical protein